MVLLELCTGLHPIDDGTLEQQICCAHIDAGVGFASVRYLEVVSKTRLGTPEVLAFTM